MSVSIQTMGSGPSLVLFHGWGFDHQIWQLLVPDLTNQFTVHLIDLPGFGQTPSMPWALFKQSLLAQLPAKLTLIGWSMGGLIATRLALEAPEHVQKIIHVASTPRFTSATDWPGVETVIFTDFYNRFLENPTRTRQQFMRMQLQGHAGTPNTREIYASHEGLQHGLMILKEWDLRTQLSALTIPTTYIFGRLDAIVPYATMQAMQQNYPDFNYVLLDKAAHIPFLSHKDTFIACLRAIL